MVEEQIEVMIPAIRGDALLTFEKGETDAKFEDERLHLAQDGRFEVFLRISIAQPQKIEHVRIAENEIGCERVPVAQRGQLLPDQLFRLLRQRGSLIKHPANFLRQ